MSKQKIKRINKSRVVFLIVCLVILIFVILFCVNKVSNYQKNIELDNEAFDVGETQVEKLEEKISIEDIIDEYKPDELGDIPVIMYHAVCENPPSVYQRSVVGFKEDLQYMYDHNYRPITCADYVDFNITTPAGMTPILLTFDDGDYRSFALERNEAGELVPVKDCAVYLMEEFYREHNDFGKAAIFFINGHDSTFLGDDKTITLEERINWLFEHGYEVSNHTDGHINLKKSSPSEIIKNIGKVDLLIKLANDNARLDVIAYPFGAKPNEENYQYLSNGLYDGHEYSYKIGLREGPSKTRLYPVIHIDYEPFNTPRLRGNKGEVGDMYSYFESYEKTPSLRFVSDGNPDVIVVPKEKEEKINKTLKIVNGKQIIVY